MYCCNNIYSPPKLTPGTILYYFQTSGENVKRFLAWCDKFEGSRDASDSAGSPIQEKKKKIKTDTKGRLIKIGLLKTLSW